MKKIVFIWAKFAPYHIDRIEAVKNLLGHEFEVAGIQKVKSADTYAWAEVESHPGFSITTLFPDDRNMPFWKTLFLLCRETLRPGVHHVFTCEYQSAYTFFMACILRLFGRRVFVMTDSKFDDKPRFLWREIGKVFLYLPYNGAFASGRRTAEYLHFLGFRKRPAIEGYNTLSLERVRRNAAIAPAPEGPPFHQRHFLTIARFIPKKNLPMLIRAYALYRQMAGDAARDLHLCGSGPEENSLRSLVAELGLHGVIFDGFLQEGGVAKLLGNSLALLLPSFDEQWGLVINEALAMGLPVICGDTVGARDALVKNAINGQAIETDNPEGLARFMFQMGEDEQEWRRMALASCKLAPLGDVSRFAAGINELIRACP